jgi:type II secretory ATPase GspE/PulE/Tfp pilus assembly ATPase PilB-like protein
MEKAYLDIKTAAGHRQLVVGDQPISIGRHSDNKVVVNDTLASRFHCIVEKTPEGYLLRDLGSSNGTRVNGRRVRSVLLNPGDVVMIGKTRLILVLPSTPAGAHAPQTQATLPAPPPVVAAAEAAAPRIRRGPPQPSGAGLLSVDDDAAAGANDGNHRDADDPIELMDLEELARPAGRAGSGGDGAEELSELDVVDDLAPGPQALSFDNADDLDGYEHALRSLADSVPDRSFTASEIIIINPRGQTIATAGPPGKVLKDAPSQMTYLMRLVLLGCLRARATDLHIEPKEGWFQLRMRVDGVMVDAARVPEGIGQRLVGIVKICSDIDPSQKNIVQEGHFSARLPNGPLRPVINTRRVDFRVSFAPAVYGQKLVLRVLDPSSAPSKFGDLGMPADVEGDVRWAIQQEAGMILVCGPTGSGKTSTLYALLRSLNASELNIVTIEDPVEIEVAGATQIPVDDEKGNTFSALLRSVLRQDPDVILVGEIRDAETARIAMQAAITGHLVFSTVHTKDTIGTVYRLLDLGVEPYLLAQGLHMVLAQRLVRQLCQGCKAPRPITLEQQTAMGKAGEGVSTVYIPIGCRLCLGTGYAGRRPFFELLSVNESLRQAISSSPSIKEVTQALDEKPFRRLREAGYQLVAQGLVPFDEVEKAVGR